MGHPKAKQSRETAVDVELKGHHLKIEEITRVAQGQALVRLTDDPTTLRRIEQSHRYIQEAIQKAKPIYGVTSGFGGMANVVVPPESASELQSNLLWFMKTGAGKRIPNADVRAAMLIRANSHLKGASGIRLELVQRMVTFLNANVTPHIYEYGSIGASGDLVPLVQIAGALYGLDPCFRVDYDGIEMDCVSALESLGLPRLSLQPKEGLAMINGTSVMTGIAANCVHQAQLLLALSLGAHALMLQGLQATNQSFHPFIHSLKPHPGQLWVADQMLGLLRNSKLARDELSGQHDYRANDLIQDRYSLRCLAQYLGPIVDGLKQITQQITVEINSATDNPLIDVNEWSDYHGGNFLGQYVGVAMDQLRYHLGLLAKHLDVQIALLVTPEFSHGLTPSLVGNRERTVNMGLKGLQISGNSMMPLLTFFGQSLVDRFPTHAEQFNQNINSQGFGSANLARQSIEIFQQYLPIALIFGVQSVDLLTYKKMGHYDARQSLSPTTIPLYEAIYNVVGRPIRSDRPLIRDDNEQPLDQFIATIAANIINEGPIASSVESIRRSLLD